MSQRVEQLFARTKQVCFGRYVLRVPLETELIFGTHQINDGFETYPGQGDKIRQFLNKKWGKIKLANASAEVIESIKGPVPGGEYFWYYNSDSAKKRDLREYFGALPINGHAFTYKGGAVTGEAGIKFAAQLPLIKALRYREETEIPREPGVCIELGFVGDATCKHQEMFDAGIHMPSLPDVTFSVSSSVMAEVNKETESLLMLIAARKRDFGANYPKLTVLRQGKKTFGIWDGEESLVRREDGTHEFDWAYIGERTTALPGSLDVGLRSKVEQNTVGAADKASISDAEALQLWDLLLGSLAFRVPVPGASRVEMSLNGLALHPGDLCPATGVWLAEHPRFRQRQEHYVAKGDTLLTASWFSWINIPAREVKMTLVKILPEKGSKA